MAKCNLKRISQAILGKIEKSSYELSVIGWPCCVTSVTYTILPGAHMPSSDVAYVVAMIPLYMSHLPSQAFHWTLQCWCSRCPLPVMVCLNSYPFWNLDVTDVKW